MQDLTLKKIKEILISNFADVQLQKVLMESEDGSNIEHFQNINISGLKFDLISIKREDKDFWEDEITHTWIFRLSKDGESIILKINEYFDSWGEEDLYSLMDSLEEV